jgi:hypothetical protein
MDAPSFPGAVNGHPESSPIFVDIVAAERNFHSSALSRRRAALADFRAVC